MTKRGVILSEAKDLSSLLYHKRSVGIMCHVASPLATTIIRCMMIAQQSLYHILTKISIDLFLRSMCFCSIMAFVKH